MKLLALVSIVLSMAAGNEGTATTLSFDEAVALAGRRSDPSTATSLRTEIAALRRSRLPSVRAEVLANSSRTLDLFSEGPFEVRFATSVLAFDYPLWDGGAMNARIGAAEAKLRSASERSRLDDARFAQLLDAFGELYLAQKQSEIIRPLFEKLSDEATRSSLLVSSGEISNLTATERREIALSFRLRLLELEARRLDAATRLRLLTGLEAEPRLVLDPSELEVEVTRGAPVRDDLVEATSVAVEQARARMNEVRASAGFRATLSGFAGVGAAESEFRDVSSDGSFGVYGLRVHLSYPLLRGAGGISIAEVRADLAQSLAIRDAALDNARARADEYRLREETSRRRITLLGQSVEAAKEREESLERLVAAGVRSESDLAQAEAERTRREVDLMASEIERWKAARLLARMTTAGDRNRAESDLP